MFENLEVLKELAKGYKDSYITAHFLAEYNSSQNVVKEYRKTGTVKSVFLSYSEEEMDLACEYFEEC